MRPKCTPGQEGSCWFAQGEPKDCECECNGANHGIAIERGFTTYEETLEYFEAREPKEEFKRNVEVDYV